MYQKTTIVGYLGRDPEMRYTPSGQPVTSFNVATNRTWTENGEKKKETTWFRVQAWGNKAENCNNYLKKGSKVLVEGRLSPDPKTGRPKIFKFQDGTAGASYELVAMTVQFLDSAADGGQAQGQPEQDDDEPPF